MVNILKHQHMDFYKNMVESGNFFCIVFFAAILGQFLNASEKIGSPAVSGQLDPIEAFRKFAPIETEKIISQEYKKWFGKKDEICAEFQNIYTDIYKQKKEHDNWQDAFFVAYKIVPDTWYGNAALQELVMQHEILKNYAISVTEKTVAQESFKKKLYHWQKIRKKFPGNQHAQRSIERACISAYAAKHTEESFFCLNMLDTVMHKNIKKEETTNKIELDEKRNEIKIPFEGDLKKLCVRGYIKFNGDEVYYEALELAKKAQQKRLGSISTTDTGDLNNWIQIRNCYNKYFSYPDDISLDAYRSESTLQRMVKFVMGVSIDGEKEIPICVDKLIAFPKDPNVLLSFAPSKEHFIFISPLDQVAFLGKLQGAEMEGTKIGRIFLGDLVHVYWLDATYFLIMVQNSKKKKTWYSIRNVHDNFTTEPLDEEFSVMKCATIEENMEYYRIRENCQQQTISSMESIIILNELDRVIKISPTAVKKFLDTLKQGQYAISDYVCSRQDMLQDLAQLYANSQLLWRRINCRYNVHRDESSAYDICRQDDSHAFRYMHASSIQDLILSQKNVAHLIEKINKKKEKRGFYSCREFVGYVFSFPFRSILLSCCAFNAFTTFPGLLVSGWIKHVYFSRWKKRKIVTPWDRQLKNNYFGTIQKNSPDSCV